MKKRIFAVVLSLIFVIGLIPVSAVFAAGSTTLYLTADKTTVNPGDTINYTVSVGAIEHFMGADFEVVIPQGLVYVANSGSVPNGLAATLGCVQAVWEESTMVFAMYGSGDYSNTSDTVILTFSCIVSADAVTGTLVPELANVALSDTNYEEINTQINTNNGKANVVVSVSGVTLDRDTISLNTSDNKTATLIATIDPDKATNKTVSWTSSDETVATVSGGVITAVKHGTTTITVKTADGGFTDVCLVKVDCSHTSKTSTTAKIANCQEGGWDAYNTCDDCGQLFSADGITKIDAIPTTIKNSSNHTDVQNYPADTATCTHQGNNAYSKCNGCGVVTVGSDDKFFGEHNYGTLISATVEKHTATELIPAVAAHYHCSVCDTYFTENKVKTTLDALTSATPIHSYSDWITSETEHWKKCTNDGCGKIVEKGDHSGGDATCNNSAVCNTCKKEYGLVDLTNHVGGTEVVGAVAASCTVGGYTGDVYCKGCGNKIKDGEDIAAGHKTIEVPAVAATHNADGNIKHYTCSGCDLLFSDIEAKTEIKINDTVVVKGVHNYSDVYVTDTENHWKECSCGQVIEKDEHKYGEWTVTKDATATEKGSKEKLCSVCGNKIIEEIPVLVVDNNDNSANNPQTGDDTLIILAIVLWVFVSCGVIIVSRFNKNRVK